MNMKKTSRGKNSIKVPDARVYLVAVLITGAIAALLRTVSMFTAYDSGIGYFTRGAALPVIATLLCVAGCVAAVAFPFFSRIDASSVPPVGSRGSSPVYFATAYAAFVMIGAFAYEIYRCFTDSTAGKFFEDANAATSAYAARSLRIQGILVIIGIVASGVSAVYFLLRLNEKPGREWQVLLGFAPGLRGVAGLGIYFDMTVEMNSPNKLMLQAALVSVMIYFLFELRMILGGKKARPRAYAAAGMAASVLTASASISIIAGYFSGLVSNSSFFTEAFFCFNMMIYIMVRTAAFVASVHNGGSAPEPAAENREKEN